MSYNRDGDILKLYNAGVTEEAICEYYDIKKPRLMQIILEQRSKKLHGDPDIRQIDTMCRILGWRENERGRLQSILHKHGYTAFDDKWRELSRNDILAIPLLGPSSACVIWLAQNMDEDDR